MVRSWCVAVSDVSLVCVSVWRQVFTRTTVAVRVVRAPFPYQEIHHKKHHQAYVTNLNAGLVQYAEAQAKNDLQKMIALQPALKFNGGGHVNHTLFWQNLAPAKEGGGAPPTVCFQSCCACRELDRCSVRECACPARVTALPRPILRETTGHLRSVSR